MSESDAIQELSTNEKKVLLALDSLDGTASPEEILATRDFDQLVEVMNAASWLQSKKLVNITEHVKTVYSLGSEGKKYVKKGLPERRALSLLMKNNGKISLSKLSKSKQLNKQEIPIAIGWLKRKNWADIKKDDQGRYLEVKKKGKHHAEKQDEDEEILEYIDENQNAELDEQKVQRLKSRKNVVKEKTTTHTSIELTPQGKEVIDKGIEAKEEISQLTPELITSGKWKEADIRPYDVTSFAPSLYGGKEHPLCYLIRTIRQIFLEMGFEEIKGGYVESCFWNMDVLFIPQDHPARDMQDTLYCKSPSSISIEEKKLLETVAKVHEHGGKIDSTGWEDSFSKEESKRALLRTHTTVNTIRYLYHNPEPPAKIFSIGRVFRKENIDSTHLPEFYQIEGIIHEKDANFRQLIGVLKEFYKKMGFEKIRYRPAYFPYTEPSMEVEVFWNDEWMELGGSGIFRPEVTKPVGVDEPVLAWGLSLERLAMLKYGLKDIRQLYTSDLEWLRETPLKQGIL